MTNDSRGGTYTLLVEGAEAAAVEVGALGALDLPAGWYAYVGSALGPGGFARVDRHRDLAAGRREGTHWHVDYLLAHHASTLDEVVTSAGVDAECAVARDLVGAADGVEGFGCSDCDCASHLFYHADRSALMDAVENAHRAVR